MPTLRDKIKNNESGILLYGLTPPKSNLPATDIAKIATTQLLRLANADIDGIVLYDIQDESGRTAATRTFEYIATIKPEIYHRDFLKSAFDAVIYKAVGNYTAAEFTAFLQNFDERNLSVFVGASSKNDTPKLTLNDAYKLHAQIAPNTTIGGICIPERHQKKGDEDLRVAGKILKGCEFFITQAVYNLETAKQFLDDFAALGAKKVPIIFTFTPCGSQKTLEFMRWLGIFVPEYFEERIFSGTNPLENSVNLALDLFEFLYKYGIAKGISVGANVESLTTKKIEIEASIALLGGIKAIINSQKEINHREIFQSASKNLD